MTDVDETIWDKINAPMTQGHKNWSVLEEMEFQIAEACKCPISEKFAENPVLLFGKIFCKKSFMQQFQRKTAGEMTDARIFGCPLSYEDFKIASDASRKMSGIEMVEHLKERRKTTDYSKASTMNGCPQPVFF